MANKSPIEWTNATWNPTVGCTKVSPGCKNCYAQALHARLTKMGQAKYAEPFETVRPWRAHLELPLAWTQPRMIFVNSMSDLFHEDVPFDYIRDVFDVMARAEQHRFQVLTKRSERLATLAPKLVWPPNVWMGVSVENSDYLSRIRDLVCVPAAVRFLSIEPLLGPIDSLPLKEIHWVIVGGESGKRRRPPEIAWIRSIRDQCARAAVPFFFKQWGGIRAKSGGNQLDRRQWAEFPIDPAIPTRADRPSPRLSKE